MALKAGGWQHSIYFSFFTDCKNSDCPLNPCGLERTESKVWLSTWPYDLLNWLSSQTRNRLHWLNVQRSLHWLLFLPGHTRSVQEEKVYFQPYCFSFWPFNQECVWIERYWEVFLCFWLLHYFAAPALLITLKMSYDSTVSSFASPPTSVEEMNFRTKTLFPFGVFAKDELPSQASATATAHSLNRA